MEGLNPPLELLITVKRSLERGHSVKNGLSEFIKESSSPWVLEVSQWMSLLQQGLSADTVLRQQISNHRRILLKTLERGLKGESIYQTLNNLEEEIVLACEVSLAQSLGRLPFLLLMPLLLLQMPAFLLLLLGPLLSEFLTALSLS